MLLHGPIFAQTRSASRIALMVDPLRQDADSFNHGGARTTFGACLGCLAQPITHSTSTPLSPRASFSTHCLGCEGRSALLPAIFALACRCRAARQ